MRIALLGFDMHGLVVILVVDDQRQAQPLGVSLQEAGITVGASLHEHAHAVAVAKLDVVAHADLVPFC